ncbi:MAG: hypothetical protein M1836_006112 [Candelina mexicana]|nr:MAG: hypothetical protein M1836_006112 [Candelina mexicana]
MSSTTEPPSTDAEETTKAWSALYSTTDSIQSAASSQFSMPMWRFFLRNLRKYRINLRPLTHVYSEDIAKVADSRRFDLQLQPGQDDRLFITMTDAEVEMLAANGEDIIEGNENEATCSYWMNKLLPITSTKTSMFRRGSDLLCPGIIPEAANDISKPPWSRMKPDSVWYYTPRLFPEPAWIALQEILARHQIRESGIIGLNLELKARHACIKTAQAQAVAAAMVALGERIEIRRIAQEKDHQIHVDELVQYFFIFEPQDIQLWRLVKTDIHEFKAWQLDLGGKITFSAVEGIQRFIVVWNKLISYLTGPVLESLQADLQKIADTSNQNSHTTKKRRTSKDETVEADKRQRRSSRQRGMRQQRA